MPISFSFKDQRTSHPSSIIALSLLLVAVLCVLGLDYIASKKGESSWLFSHPEGEKPAPVPKDTLGTLVLERLAQLGLPPDSTDRFQDRSGMIHLMINLEQEQYNKLEPELRKDLQENDASIIKKEEKQSEDKNFFLWEIEGKEEERLTILFSCQKELPPPEPERNRVAIVMDDMGNSLGALYDLLNMDRPITVAVLPYSTFARETAQLAHQNGLEVILHLPLESINNDEENNGTEGMIYSWMSPQKVLETVERDLEQVPHIKGVNNHMGSKITTSRTSMELILRFLKDRGLYFVDSRTTGQTVAYDIARSLEIPAAQRHVFLDGETDEKYIKGKMIELFRLASQRGKALGICHPSLETLKVLRENIHFAEEYGLELVFASQIVE